MRVMTHHAFDTRVMFCRIYSHYICPSARRVRKIVVTPEAKFPFLVYRKLGRIGRMVQSRSVAVFALYDCMRSFDDAFVLIAVTFLAVFVVELVLDLEVLPPVFIILIVKSVHVAAIPNSEVLRYKEFPCNKNEDYQGDRQV